MNESSTLRSILEAATPFSEFLAARRTSSAPKRSGNPGTKANADTDPLWNMSAARAALQYLVSDGHLDLSARDEWVRLGMALKNSFDETGWEQWVELSRPADGYESDEDCRKTWDSFKDGGDRPITIATYIKRAMDLGWKAPRGSGRAGGDGSKREGGGLGKGVDPAAYAVDLAEESDDEFWLDQNQKAHVSYLARIADGAHVLRHTPIAGTVYKTVLQDRFFRATGTKVLSPDQASAAVSILEYGAKDSGITFTSALRVGRHENGLYVDLGRPDGVCIEMDAEGWRPVKDCPIRFIRGSRWELPMPEAGGTLEDFRPHFNLSQDDLIRAVGFMIGAFNIGASFPLLLIDGPQGSGKSNLGDKIIGLLDPPRQPKDARMSFNAKEQDLHLGASAVHVPFFDNVSSFSASAADALCRVSTGGGSGSRKLYTDDQYHQVNVLRPVIITCIGTPSSRPDLLSRSIRITALSIGHEWRTERVVWGKFDAARPRLLGYVLTCVACAIRNRTKVEDAVERGEIQLARMADFAEFVEGASEMLGLEMGQFSTLLSEGQNSMQTEAVLGDPVGGALVDLFSKRPEKEVEGPARDIIARLTNIRPNERRWPSTNKLTYTLRRLEVGLAALGIKWSVQEPTGRDNVQHFKIWADDRFRPLADDEHDDGGGHF